MKIDKKHVLEIIEATPLVSIDLVIRNPSNKVLLGKRNNRLQWVIGLSLVEGYSRMKQLIRP